MDKIKCFLLEKTDKVNVIKGQLDDGSPFTSEIPVWRRNDTGEEMTLRDAPPGAIWRATWFENADLKDMPLIGEDGKSYVCRTPGGDWMIDSRASNCTMKDDMVHKCWCRHGEAPDFTVDKNGNTCGAGGGSIIAGNYHGFLRNGYLEVC